MCDALVEDRAFQIPKSGRHGLEPLPHRLEQAALIKLRFGEACLLQPRLQVPPVPAVEGDLANVVCLAEIPQERRDILVLDRCPRRCLQQTLPVP